MVRKVDIGSVLSRTFNTYGAQFTLLIPAALAVFLPVAIISGLAFAASPVLGALSDLVFPPRLARFARVARQSRRGRAPSLHTSLRSLPG